MDEVGQRSHPLLLMNQLLQELRDATSDLHRQLDRLIPESSPAADLSAYQDYLLRFRRGVAASWPMLDWNLLDALDLPEAGLRKNRYHRLGTDLGNLGLPHPPLADEASSDAATSVGCLYVLEGSIHGSGVILSDLRSHGTAIPEDSLGFLGGFGDDTPRMWSSFVSWLRSLETSPGFTSGACEAARATFSHFIHFFDQTRWNPANPT